jgi:hypothetical protein
MKSARCPRGALNWYPIRDLIMSFHSLLRPAWLAAVALGLAAASVQAAPPPPGAWAGRPPGAWVGRPGAPVYGGGYWRPGAWPGYWRPGYWRPGYWGPSYWGPAWGASYWGAWPGWWGPVTYPSVVISSPVVIEPEPQIFVEQGQPAPAAPAQQWWYWCAPRAGYYPYVQSCPEPWQRVPPQPVQ